MPGEVSEGAASLSRAETRGARPLGCANCDGPPLPASARSHDVARPARRANAGSAPPRRANGRVSAAPSGATDPSGSPPRRAAGGVDGPLRAKAAGSALPRRAYADLPASSPAMNAAGSTRPGRASAEGPPPPFKKSAGWARPALDGDAALFPFAGARRRDFRSGLPRTGNARKRAASSASSPGCPPKPRRARLDVLAGRISPLRSPVGSSALRPSSCRCAAPLRSLLLASMGQSPSAAALSSGSNSGPSNARTMRCDASSVVPLARGNQ